MSYRTTARPKQWLHWLLRWQYLGLCLLVLITLILHFSIIMQPNELVFDEQYYVADAKSIIEGEGTLRPEHPPLGKLFVVSGIRLFGDRRLSPRGRRRAGVIRPGIPRSWRIAGAQGVSRLVP